VPAAVGVPGASGTLAATFEARLGGKADRALFTVPVSQAGRETVQATFSVEGPGSAMPEVRLPAGADPGRGRLDLSFSPGIAGQLTAPLASLASYPYDCLEQSTSRALGALYELRLAAFRPVPDGRAAELRGRVERQIRLVESRELGGGFAAWPGGDWSRRDPALTAWALDFLREAGEDGFAVPKGLVESVTGYLAGALNPENRDEEGRLSLSARLYVLGALGRAGVPREADLETIYSGRADLTLGERIGLLRAVRALPPSRARTAQLMELIPTVVSELELGGVTARIREQRRVIEDHALWLYGTEDLSAQALLALAEAAPHHDLLPALLLGVAGSGGAGDFGTTSRAVTVLRAVWGWLEATEGARGGPGGEAGDDDGLDLAVRVLQGQKTVLEGSLSSPADPPLEGSIPASDLASGPAPSWEIAGTGRAWAFRRLSWAPAVPDLTAQYARGFTLTRSFQRVRPEPGPAGESRFRRGEVVKVSVTMMTSVPRWNVVLEDPVPAGLEPVDFGLRDQNPNLAALLEEGSAEQDPCAAFWRWYDHEEIRPDRIRLFAGRLEPGVYTYSYLARPVTPGTYLLPGTYAEEMYNPENHGRAAGLTLTVEK
jgi:uncharacterized protein YfaS (alpha-2-macroglobulin family)